ncbi:wall-associated receptor kinase 5-like [Aegilops tauschii subsp. strangulata]|nr:wall-associated receptor kinase 5-like [Aegilops tauschii subsp. strangulata]
MASVLLLGAIIILLNLTSMSSAQPNHKCRTHCGDIEIPYPFGIGIGCAIEQRFEVNCSRTADGIERPFIHEQEVLNISASRGQSRVLMTIPSYCYNSSIGKMDLHPWDFYLAWPYRFSDVQNKFISIGCNSMGYIYTGKSRYVAGCVSVCWSPEELANGSCVGIGCCQNTITKGLTSYHVVFYDVDYLNSTTSWHFNPCGYSMVVEAENFVFNSEYITTTRFNDTYKGRQPVVLDWAIGNVTCEAARRNMSSYACRTGNTVCVDSPNGLGYLCNCSSGYQGNPYLSNGCTDVNECEHSPSPCPKSATCQNIVGGYQCSCPFGGNFSKETNSCTNGLIGVIIGLSCGIGVLFIALVSTLLIRRWNQGIKIRVRKAHFRRNKCLVLEQLISSDESAMHSTKIFSLDELEKATDNFDSARILGLGGHGTVYKGILSDQRVVAIKKSKMVDQIEIDQFINELAIMSQINHRNVVKLFGCCLESEVPLLVYEFISNGTLSEILHGDNLSSRISLTWDDRIRIASEASSALAYLHSAASIPIFHRDVKSANILLTDNVSVKVADFGASRSISIDETRVVTAVQGTFGYLDPEYYHTGQLTEKSDVYSFGVIIVELLTRKKSIFLDSHGENKNLCHFFVQRQQDNTIMEIVDVQVLEEGTERQIDEMASLAMACLKHRGEERPTMKEVELRLQSMRGKMVMKRNHELERHGEAVTLLPSNYSNYFSTSFGAANSSNQCVTRCCTMERELVSWTDLPR